MNEDDFHATCAIHAMLGLFTAYKSVWGQTVGMDEIAHKAWALADAMVEARKERYGFWTKKKRE